MLTNMFTSFQAMHRNRKIANFVFFNCKRFRLIEYCRIFRFPHYLTFFFFCKLWVVRNVRAPRRLYTEKSMMMMLNMWSAEGEVEKSAPKPTETSYARTSGSRFQTCWCYATVPNTFPSCSRLSCGPTVSAMRKIWVIEHSFLHVTYRICESMEN